MKGLRPFYPPPHRLVKLSSGLCNGWTGLRRSHPASHPRSIVCDLVPMPDPKRDKTLTEPKSGHYKLRKMSRFLLALRCFFAVLLRFRLPDDAVRLLPPDSKRLSDAKPAERTDTASLPKPAPVEAKPVEAKPAEAKPAEPSPAKPAEPSPADRDALRQRGAVQLLSVLQREGRLIDFLLEDIDGYSDAQVGAAVRDIHRGCRKGLSEHLQIVPIRPEPDEALVKIAAGHDPSQVRLIGHVTGRPPFEGSLRHHGWRTTKCSLADIPAGHDPTVICPAEVEIAG